MSDGTSTSKIDLWLAATMRPHPEVERRLVSAGTTPDVARQVVVASRGAGLHQPGEADRSAIIGFFGAPSSQSDDQLAYELALWPEHVFVWDLDASGRVTNSTFVRREVRDQRGREGAAIGVSGASAFKLWYHTEADVRNALGEPQGEEGWWPEQALTYQAGDSAEAASFVFDHGLLREIAKHGAPAATRD